MSGFNTKTPMMDFSPWLKRDFSTQNRGGALAEAFQIAADLNTAYGQTADKELLGKYANETDSSKIDENVFYDKTNALNAKNIIDQNKTRVFQDEQRGRQNELDARNDAEYYIEQFNNEVLGDVWKYDKDEFFEKHGNSGGLNSAMMYDAYNKKEDRNLSLEDRNRKIEIDNLNLQNTRNSMARANEEYNYSKQQREQNKKDNDFLVAYESGYVPESELDSYRSSVSPAVFNGVMKQKKVNDITNKYKTLDEFRNSEDWATTPFEIKNEMFKSKVYEQPKSTYQEKIEQDLISDIGEMSAKLGTDNLANVDYATALADGKVTQNDLATYTYKLSRLPASKEVDKK